MPETTAFTVATNASPAETGAVCRAVLATIWPDLDWFNIDLTTSGEAPEQEAAVATLARHRTHTLVRKRLTELAHIELGDIDGADEEALVAVLALATVTLGSDGWSTDREQIIYDVNDAGTSCHFELTSAQKAGVDQRLRDSGLQPDALVPID